MVVFGSFGLLRRFRFLSPPLKSCLSEKTVEMAIWVSTTVSFSPLLESVVSANSVIFIGITIESTVSGKYYSSPRGFVIILLMGWCVFVPILGVLLPKIEWRYIYRIIIFLLVMEVIWYTILLMSTLGIAEDMKSLESKDCMLHMDLMEDIHGCWHYMLSTEVMEEEDIHMEDHIFSKNFLIISRVLPSAFYNMHRKENKDYDVFTKSFFATVALLREALEENIPKFMEWNHIISVTYMEKLKPILRTFGSMEIQMIVTKNLVGKRLCVYMEENYRVMISHKDLSTEDLVPLCLHFRITYTHIGFKAAVCKKKVQPSDAAFKSYRGKANMKLDNNGSYDRLASKATLRKASSKSFLMYYSHYMAHTSAYVIICVTMILYTTL